MLIQRLPALETDQNPIWMSMIGRVVAVSDEPDGVELKLRDEYGEVVVLYKSDIIPRLKQEMVVSGFFTGTDYRNLKATPLAAIDVSWLDPDHSTIVASFQSDPVLQLTPPFVASSEMRSDDVSASAPEEVAADSEIVKVENLVVSERDQRDHDVSLLIDTISENGAERRNVVPEDMSFFRPVFSHFGLLGRLDLYPSDIEREVISISLGEGIKKDGILNEHSATVTLDALCVALMTS